MSIFFNLSVDQFEAIVKSSWETEADWSSGEGESNWAGHEARWNYR